MDQRTLEGFDCVAILTDHRAFDYGMIVRHADLVVDTRNAVKQPAENVFRLGAPAPNRQSRSASPELVGFLPPTP